MRSYTITEWSLLPYKGPDDDHGLSRSDALALSQVAQLQAVKLRLSPQAIISLEHSGLRAGQIVGVIVTQDCRLEILPKIDAEDEGISRQTLYKMLTSVLRLNLATGRKSATEEQPNSILEILIRHFAEDLFKAVHRGLPRRYQNKEEDLGHLRGQLNTVRQFTRFAASPHRLACRFDELTVDTPLNQILKAACRLLRGISRDGHNLRLLSELAPVFDEVRSLDLGRPLPVKDIHLDRTNSGYRELLNLAILFLNGRSQSIYSGEGSGFSLLFEMNTLFEEYVGASVNRLRSRLNAEVALQGPQRYALYSSSGAGRFATRPDISLRYADSETVILDTKWKRLKEDSQTPPWGVSSSDIYQMLAYAGVYQASHVVLLYPHIPTWSRSPGILECFHAVDGTTKIVVATLDITKTEFVGEQLLNLLQRLRKDTDLQDEKRQAVS